MLPLPAGKEASPGGGAFRYARHRPKRTLLYQLVEEYYPVFLSQLAAQGTAVARVCSSRSSRITSDAAVSSTVSYGYAAIAVTPNTWSPSVANAAAFVPAVGHGGESAALLVDEVFPEQPVRQWVSELSVSLTFPVREPPGHHGPSARHRLSLHRHPPDKEGRVFP